MDMDKTITILFIWLIKLYGTDTAFYYCAVAKQTTECFVCLWFKICLEWVTTL